MTPKVFRSPEELELRRRLPMALEKLAALVERIKDLRLRANPERLPPELAAVEKGRLLEGLYHAILADAPETVHRSVVRRMADKIGEYLLWRRETSTPVIHELLALAPWWIGAMPIEVFQRLKEIGLKYVLNGSVAPIQMVWRDLLDAPLAYMGHCLCRSAKVVSDLHGEGGAVYTTASEADKRLLLDRVMQRCDALRGPDGALPHTVPQFALVFDKLDKLRAAKSPDYRLETLFAETYPNWEFLPVLAAKYTPNWIRSMHQNRKAFEIHKELAFELATAFYLGKGTLFSTMTFFDTPYCICTCPTPENGGGCVLSNWYYQGGSDYSLLPNLSHHGRRRDADGVVLPCDKFPIRATRECIGCGCVHGAAQPRAAATILAEADRVLAEYGRL